MITLYGTSWRTLQIVHPRFSGGVCSGQLFEDLHTTKSVWERPAERYVWKERQDGRVGYVIEGVDACAPEGPYRLTFEAAPSENDVVVTATVENLGEEPWRRLVGEGCLGLRPFLWSDAAGKRIMMVTADGLVSRYDVPTVLSMRRPTYAFSAFEGEMALAPNGINYLGSENHWGQDGLTTAPITEGIVIAHDRDIGYTGDDSFIGFAWDRVAYLWTRNTNCIHCAALFGDVQPGQSVTRQGRIYVAETAEDLIERYHEDFPQRGRAQ